MNLESLLSSSCRRRILRVLSSSGSTNMMELVRKTNSTYNQVNANLGILADEGIVFDCHVGRMRSIRLNRESLKVQRLLKALKILASQNEDAA
jgi:predicted transcriptional regulator